MKVMGAECMRMCSFAWGNEFLIESIIILMHATAIGRNSLFNMKVQQPCNGVHGMNTRMALPWQQN